MSQNLIKFYRSLPNWTYNEKYGVELPKCKGGHPHTNIYPKNFFIILGMFTKKIVSPEMCGLGERNLVGLYIRGAANNIGGGHPPGGSYPLGEIFDYF